MMSDSSNNCPSSSGESQPLLSPSHLSPSSASNNQSFHHFRCTHFCYQLLKYTCLPSKAAVILICLAGIVGAINIAFSGLSLLAADFVVGSLNIDQYYTIFISYLFCVTALILFPVSGFLADVFCGRYRVVMISMCFFIVSFVLLSGAAAIALVSSDWFLSHWSHVKGVLLVILLVLFEVTYGIGTISYYANFINLVLIN